MNCKWYAEETGICCNASCPVCVDFCPVTQYMEICKFAEENEAEMDDKVTCPWCGCKMDEQLDTKEELYE